MASVRAYYQLAKPGIVYGNAISAIAGFLLASQGVPYLPTFFGMLIGVCLVMASACVFNNYLDRNIDDMMARTKGRALVTGEISVPHAMAYGTALGLAGLFLLVMLANPLAALVAAFGHFSYVFVYGYAKRKSVHGTLVGSIPGATPPVIGYVAVTNQFDLTAALLFLILVFWQMPHFYAIALFRLHDYKRAGIPVLPAVKGATRTKLETLYYTVAFILATASLTVLGYTGFIFAGVMFLLGLKWLQIIGKGASASDDALWGREVFRFSLWVLLVLCVMLSLDPYLV
jgi:protoheme IX farnesyltransferase